jgi:ATP-dependent DNA helicase RecG
MEESELSALDIRSYDNYFSITLYHKSVYSIKEQQWLALFDKFQLSNEEKKIVVLGMNEREIAPKDIYSAISTQDRNINDRTVTTLRVKGILIEIRTNIQATTISKKTEKPKQEITRFKVQLPDENITTQDKADDYGIFIANIPNDFNERKLREVFSAYGVIRRVLLPIRKFDGSLRGFCFVWFENEEAVREALKADGYYIEGRQLKISKYITPIQPKRKI